MKKVHSIYPTIFVAALGLTIPQSLFAEAPAIKTKGPIIHLADNLQEEAMLGWCIDTDGREFTELLHAHSCKPSGDDVLFTYSSESGMIASATYENKCMAYNAPENEVNPFGLIDCDDAASIQKFTYDAESMEMRLGSDATQCLTVSPVIDNAGPFQSRDLFLAPCESLAANFKQWVIQE